MRGNATFEIWVGVSGVMNADQREQLERAMEEALRGVVGPVASVHIKGEVTLSIEQHAEAVPANVRPGRSIESMLDGITVVEGVNADNILTGRMVRR